MQLAQNLYRLHGQRNQVRVAVRLAVNAALHAHGGNRPQCRVQVQFSPCHAMPCRAVRQVAEKASAQAAMPS